MFRIQGKERQEKNAFRSHLPVLKTQGKTGSAQEQVITPKLDALEQ